MKSEAGINQRKITMKSLKNLIRRHLCQRLHSSHSPGNYKLHAYQHDQCERSLHMYLFTMEKRDITLLLVLTIAFNALCVMVASFAPKSHVIDTVILGQSQLQPRDERRGAELYYSLAGESVGDLRDQDQTIEKRMITRPLNSLNRPMNFQLGVEFDLIMDNSTSENNTHDHDSNQYAQNVVFGSYRLDWLLEPLQERHASHCDNDCEKESKDWSILSRGRRADVESIESKAPAGIDVMFCCNMLEASAPQLNLILEDAQVQPPIEEMLDRGHLFRCQTPELSFSYKISDLKRKRYGLIIRMSDISFLSQNREHQMNNTGDAAINLKQLRADSARISVTLSHTNSSFTFFTIFIHLFFLVISLCVGCCFIVCLAKYPLRLWSLEQRWTALLFFLLLGANRPFYTLEFLGGIQRPAVMQERPTHPDQPHEQPAQQEPPEQIINPPPVIAPSQNHYDLVDSILDLTLVCGLLLSWICFAHSIRQMSRPFLRFYAPKLAIVGAIWLMAIAALLLAEANQLMWRSSEPCLSQAPFSNEIINQNKLDIAFYTVLVGYLVNLVYHFARTAIELKPMSYFIVRYRIQATLCAMILINYATIVLMVPSYHVRAPPHHLDLLSDPNSSEPGGADAARQSASRQTFYRSTTQRKPSGALPGDPVDLIEFVSRWKVDATDEAKGSLLNLLPQSHAFDSACSFLCYVMVNNLYVLVCAYLYWPVLHTAPIPCKLFPSASSDEGNEDSKNLGTSLRDS